MLHHMITKQVLERRKMTRKNRGKIGVRSLSSQLSSIGLRFVVVGSNVTGTNLAITAYVLASVLVVHLRISPMMRFGLAFIQFAASTEFISMNSRLLPNILMVLALALAGRGPFWSSGELCYVSRFPITRILWPYVHNSSLEPRCYGPPDSLRWIFRK